MNTAQQAFELGEPSRVQSILDAYQGPFAKGQDPRGFEWFFWSRQNQRWQSRLEGHTAPVLAVDISQDGRWIVSGSHDGTIRIHDTRKEVESRTIEAHESTVYSLSISPDGSRSSKCCSTSSRIRARPRT